MLVRSVILGFEVKLAYKPHASDHQLERIVGLVFCFTLLWTVGYPQHMDPSIISKLSMETQYQQILCLDSVRVR